ncbi:MAG: hypothetical protein JWN44_30 [Myxococcales bacterium]|nr:hypothetical protein [Myxococcales bacterium]
MDQPPPVKPSVNPTGRWAPHKMAAGYVAAPSAPPDAHADRVVYGLMQPLLGARMLFTHRELLEAALVPAALLAMFCACVALIDPPSWTFGGIVRRFYHVFAVLAPLPSFLLARHYARLAATARNKFGFGPVEPAIESMRRALGRVVKQTVLVAVGVIPVTAVLHFIPVLGGILIQVVVAVWALHWVVVDAFDSARVLRPGETVADLDAMADKTPQPWFVRLCAEGETLPVVGRILRRFARWLDKLSRPWREEIAMIELHPSLMIGFALSTVALLATPVLNLLFRPIVIIGASHVLGRLESGPPALPPAANPPGTPPPASGPPPSVTPAA